MMELGLSPICYLYVWCFICSLVKEVASEDLHRELWWVIVLLQPYLRPVEPSIIDSGGNSFMK